MPDPVDIFLAEALKRRFPERKEPFDKLLEAVPPGGFRKLVLEKGLATMKEVEEAVQKKRDETHEAQKKWAIVCFPLKPFHLAKDKEFFIGRSPDVDLVLPAALVSRKHAHIFWTENGFAIEDLGSSNGTYLNGVRLTSKLSLKAEDRVRIGTFFLRIKNYKTSLDELVENEPQRGLDETMKLGGSPIKTKKIRAEKFIGSFSGNIKEVGITELLQLMNFNRKSGILKIKAQKGPGWIFVEDGDVIHAEYGKKEGVDAVALLLKVTEGSFNFSGNKPSSKKTIFMPTTGLLVECARKEDEEKQQQENG